MDLTQGMQEMDPYNTADANPQAAGAGGMQPPLAAANSSNPYAAPGAMVRDVGAEGDVVLASRLARLGAALIDSAFIFVPAILIAIMTPGIRNGTSSNPSSFVLGLFGLGVIAFVVYQFVLLYRHGQTVGKKIVGIRIVRPDGGRASFPRLLFLRYGVPGLIGAIPLVGSIFSLVNVLFIFAEDRRCLHDRIADTIVVDA